MGLYSSFYASLSGLATNANALSVIGNNLANLNTVGYKSSSAAFQDLFSSTMSAAASQGNGNPMQIGLGTRLGAISQNFGQGSFQTTGNATDMAIQGMGFFVVQTKSLVRGYTRAGNFTFDKSGMLVDPNGDNVMGWNRVGAVLSTNTAVVPIQIDMGITSPPSATTTVTATSNLNSDAATGTTFTAPLQIYDSLGASHSLIFTYTKTAVTGVWNLAVTTDGGAAVAGAPASVTFDASGILTSPLANPTLAITGWTNGAANQSVNWNIWTNGVSSLTGFSAPSSTSNSSQDGFGAGSVNSIVVDQNGIISGNFTNGQTLQLSQIAIATFANMNGLSKMGQNIWSDTLSSGGANVGAASQGGRGSILSSNLELSNVDVAEEFTKLIINQRGYQANSRVVTTSDQLLQETLNLKQ